MIIGSVKEIWRYPVKSMAGEKLSLCSVGPAGIPGDRGWAIRDESSGEISGGKRLPKLMLCEARYQDEPVNGIIPDVDIMFPDGTELASSDKNINARLSEFLVREVSLWARQPKTNRSHYRRAGVAPVVIGRLTRIKVFRRHLPKILKYVKLEGDVRKLFSREPGEPIPDLSKLPQEVFEFTSPPGTYFDAYPLNLMTTASLATMASFNPSATWDVRRFRPNFLIETADGFEGFVESTWVGRTFKIGNVLLKGEIPCSRCGMTTREQKALRKDPSVLRSIVKDADQNLGLYLTVVAGGKLSIGDKLELV